MKRDIMEITMEVIMVKKAADYETEKTIYTETE